MKSVNMNTEELRKVAHSTDSGQRLFGYLANRERDRSNLDIRRLATLLSVDRESLIKVFKKLESLNIGRIEYSRHNKPFRFHWNYSLRDVGQVINTQDVDLTPMPASKAVEPLQQRVPIVVRNGKLEIEIPADLQSDQFEAILKSIKGMQQ